MLCNSSRRPASVTPSLFWQVTWAAEPHLVGGLALRPRVHGLVLLEAGLVPARPMQHRHRAHIVIAVLIIRLRQQDRHCRQHEDTSCIINFYGHDANGTC